MDPQQELFTKLRQEIIGLGYDVYDAGLPPADTPYPFVYIADSNLYDNNRNKTCVFGEITQTIHVWHNDPKLRGTISLMLLRIKDKARSFDHTTNFTWIVTNISQRLIADNTTGTTLMHGVLEITYSFS